MKMIMARQTCWNGSIKDKIKELCLPELSKPSDYHICSVDDSSISLRTIFRTEDEARKWLHEYQENTKTTWRVSKTYTRQIRNVWKIIFKCQHSIYPRNGKVYKHKTKNTYCHANITFSISKIQFGAKKTRSSNPHLPTYPTSIRMNFVHNHELCSVSSLRYRDISSETKSKLLGMFEKGHSAASAIDLFKAQLLLNSNSKDEYELTIEDRALCPDLNFCTRLYHSVFRPNQEPYAGTARQEGEKLKALLESYSVSSQPCVAMECLGEENIVFAVCTPIMKRAHQYLETSSEVVYIDSFGSLNRKGCQFYLLATLCSMGGIPLGMLITTSEDEEVLKKALELYLTLLNGNSFNGKGQYGPNFFLTNDCDALRSALKSVFPLSTHLLCIFQVLKTVYRWLNNNNNKIRRENRKELFEVARRILYSKSEVQINQNYYTSLSNDVVTGYPEFTTLLAHIFSRKQMWGLPYRKSLPTCGNNMYITEAAFRITMDKIYHRTKSSNIRKLFYFAIVQLESYYFRKLVEFYKGRVENSSSGSTPDDKTKITQVSEHGFVVKGTKNEFLTVQLDVQTCTCDHKVLEGLCTHIHSVVQEYYIDSYALYSYESTKKLFYLLATGKSVEEGVINKSKLPPTSSNCIEVNSSSLNQARSENSIISNVEDLDMDVDCDASEELTDEVSSCLKDLENFTNEMASKVKTNPEEYCAVVQKFLSSHRSLKTQADELRALSNFGLTITSILETHLSARVAPTNAVMGGKTNETKLLHIVKLRRILPRPDPTTEKAGSSVNEQETGNHNLKTYMRLQPYAVEKN